QSTGSERSTGKVVDDATITARVKSKLLADKEVSGLAVNVDTYKGTVQLNGFVNTAAEKAKAEQLAKSVEGVQKVDNNLTVKK
ncbi:MAG TPA: BON domain-containing protein, partial [Burkholderiales bacterium]|nr:BON domain-containing protein [Burkholderiales bacterium]